MPNPRPIARHVIEGSLLALVAFTVAPGRSGAQVPPGRPSAPTASEKPAQTHAGTSTESRVRHALDPLEPEEIRRAVEIVRSEKKLAESFRFVTVTLNEPAKAAILHPQAGATIPREVFLVLLDNATGRGYEAVVNLTTRSVTRFEALPAGRPAVDHAR